MGHRIRELLAGLGCPGAENGQKVGVPFWFGPGQLAWAEELLLGARPQGGQSGWGR